MNKQTLSDTYSAYIDCLNRQDWANLGQSVDENVHYNGERIGLSGYRAMLERDFRQIPDLRFVIDRLIADPPHIAARLCFDCTPVGELFDLPVNGRRVVFSENVFYEFKDGKVCDVWSVIDKAAVAAQLT
ncbi:ester cyclase [Pseudomonas frederiksbergensis]|uniref:Ester cyclase n=1 Tax=Pseudomonas frederiksbergensis TaxID=104087 RepID=A0A423K7K2_9PSED|nr:ester cyclase [Pseudomonas frederiksbergensis]RON47731.1 ester cyclase [Pseudomonas frederiksbergensis]